MELQEQQIIMAIIKVSVQRRIELEKIIKKMWNIVDIYCW